VGNLNVVFGIWTVLEDYGKETIR